MRKLAYVAAGGFCGALARYLLAAPLLALAAHLTLPGVESGLAYDVLAINLSGALALGLIYGLVELGAHVPHDIRLLVGTGFLGAYTTFSTYVYGGEQLLASGKFPLMLAGGLYLVGSLALGVFCAQCGYWLAEGSLLGMIATRRRLQRALAGSSRSPMPGAIRAIGIPIADVLNALDLGRLDQPFSADEAMDDDDYDDLDDLREEELV